MDLDARLQSRAHSKAYYERLKQDPEKLAARNARVAANMRKYRARKQGNKATSKAKPEQVDATDTLSSLLEGLGGLYG
jgi:hypothetical protein